MDYVYTLKEREILLKCRHYVSDAALTFGELNIIWRLVARDLMVESLDTFIRDEKIREKIIFKTKPRVLQYIERELQREEYEKFIYGRLIQGYV